MRRIAIIDIETTGLNPPDALIELGVVIIKEVDGEQDCQRQSLFGLGDQIMTFENRAIHHIDPSNLDGLEPITTEALLKLIGDAHVICAHNAAFEQKWIMPLLINTARAQTGAPIPWICTKKCAMRQWPNTFNSYSNQVLRYALPIPDCTDFRFDPPHRALPDALVTTEILKILLSYQSVDTLVQWTAEPIIFARLPFGKHKGQLLADVPADYLNWLLRQTDIDDDLRATVTHELARRRAALTEHAL
jgi:exodeoxyribonuclease X